MQAEINKAVINLINVLEVVLNATLSLLCAYTNFMIKNSMKAYKPNPRRVRDGLKIEVVVRPQSEDGVAATHRKFPVMGEFCRHMVCINLHQGRLICGA